MAEINHLNIQLVETFQSMKKEGLVDEHFIFVYSLKEHVGDPFYLEIIPAFCSDARDVMKSLAQIINDGCLDKDQMKEYVYKVKGSSLTLGACRMAVAFSNFERAIDSASKEECLKALNQAQREYTAVEGKLHICLQLERKIILLAAGENNA